MNKGNHSFQQDENLREALRQDETALPQLPADLNDRLMKRLHPERRQRHFAVWPWVAAACVVATVAVLLPSRESSDVAMTGSGELTAQTSSIATEQDSRISQQETKDIESPATNQDYRIANPDTRDRRIVNSTERTEPKKHSETEQKTEVMLAQEKAAHQPEEETTSSEMVPTDLSCAQPKPQQIVLTERDIPISRPENYRYTREELALMRRQANEAYVKWMELEMEIMKYQYEQVAKQ